MRWVIFLLVCLWLFSSGCQKHPEDEMSKDRIEKARQKVKQAEESTPNLPVTNG